MPRPVQFVDLETARATRGLRLVLAGGIPSPWSEAAKGIFAVKDVPFVAVRLLPTDKEVRSWARTRNAPVALYDDEPGRTGWADILELAERIGPAPSLVPKKPRERVRMFGLAHEVVGEGDLAWNARLVTIADGIETDGARGFPPFVGKYLGARYGFEAARVALARERVVEVLALLAEELGAGPFFFGEELTALDVYSAAVVNVLDPLPDDVCPILPPIRHAFESMRAVLGALPPALVAHRERMYAQHLEWPIVT
ncbi:MAG: glutathione S-transferase C-terminal domain-containing protein [Polyangiaceae bacterium]